MARVRIFNPSSYTARSYFAGNQGEERRSTVVAHRKNRHHHHYRARNPLGITGKVVKDAAFVTGGALGSLFLAGQFSSVSGWAGVGVTGAAALAMLFAGKMFGAETGEELFKGGLVATIISALHQAGFASNLGLGLYSPSWFGVPTASDQYLRAYGANMLPANRGAGTIFFPGPGGTLIPAAAPALPPGTHPAAAAAAAASGKSGMGFHRFRSRYAGNY